MGIVTTFVPKLYDIITYLECGTFRECFSPAVDLLRCSSSPVLPILVNEAPSIASLQVL